MSDWQSFLGNCGAILDTPYTLSFGEPPADYSQWLNQPALIPLAHLGLIAVEGPDSARFLQGQLTCDVLKLNVGESVPGACCNPKGRMLANFVLYRIDEQRFLLQLHRSLTGQLIQSLTKYAVFFKTVLSDVSDSYLSLGISEDTVADISALSLIALHSLGDGRRILIVHEKHLADVWQSLTLTANPRTNKFWQWQDIVSGIGYVQAETVEIFIPQMLNLQALEAISFKKGCYTGQEVVARMKYLGKLKRHMYRVTTSATDPLPAPGTPCYLAGGEQSIGNLVNAAQNGQMMDLLVVLTDDSASSNELVIGQGEPRNIVSIPLPYNID
ncbi:MAG: folate-binding protein [Gammaproteobacteria bacterium]|nr:MAG: folate-binding protein [Gammaproteobacteria bacterium]